jgi:arsenate reductase
VKLPNNPIDLHDSQIKNNRNGWKTRCTIRNPPALPELTDRGISNGIFAVSMGRNEDGFLLGDEGNMANRKLTVLFLCTGNSCRSQMAEGWARTLKNDQIAAYSAGIEKHGLNANAVRVMQEAGVDISQQQSNTVAELDAEFDVVVTVCSHADGNCPAFPGAPRVVHVGFDDPPKLAKSAKTEEEALAHYRRVRDEIRDFVARLPESISDGEDRADLGAVRDQTDT